MAEEIELTSDNPYANGVIVEFEDGTKTLERQFINYPEEFGEGYEYTKQGDTLDKLAFTYYQNSKKWHVLADANPHLRDFIMDESLPIGVYYRIPIIDNDV